MISELQKILLSWSQTHQISFPWRNPSQKWHGLIAEILLQRTRAENVIPVFHDFVSRFPDPSTLAEASLKDIETVIRPLGLRWRSALLKQLGETIVLNNNILPLTREELCRLPGVGVYVASAFLCFHADVREIIIDSNIVRFIGRLEDYSVNNDTRRRKWIFNYVDALTPERGFKEFNYALLDFTRRVCSVKPDCARCPIGEKFCLYRRRILRSENT